ncbi:UDP-2,4-diacetamido-2,4,6-trideoxy-beta-L-altropyranose hydrolase [Brachymonas wangyanguii]|uniref:UDP-2,4-diacetamido-2,4, 6-trideoxy-beta-L-altropyranose hydrolase n=1 Tax=Brachymonas wangyanguii TaxID=3130163 RepID=UPI00307FC443
MTKVRTAAFRVDASLDMGTGHVMRCLTLADELGRHGVHSIFVSSAHEGNLTEFVSAKGYEVRILPLGDLETSNPDGPAHAHWLGKPWEQDAQQTLEVLQGEKFDWLVVDHYALDSRWELAVKPAYARLLVIDDLADRAHASDAVLDQNLGSTEQRYAGKVPGGCRVFAGAKYAMLRPEFAALRDVSLTRRQQGEFQRLLITMGGVDKHNATGQVLQAIQTMKSLPANLQIDVVMGQHAPWLEVVRNQVANMPHKTVVHVNTPEMAKLMVTSDLAIGAAGSTSWERCALGLPTIMAVLAENQREAAQHLGESGAVLVADMDGAFSDNVRRCVEQIVEQPDLLKRMSRHAAAITSGDGAQILAKWMKEYGNE